MKHHYFRILAAAGLLACTLVTVRAAPREEPRSAAPAGAYVELEACRLVNQIRTGQGLPALEVDPRLGTLARVKARDMEEQGYFSHNSPTYGSPFNMMKDFGLTYAHAGENIAMGFSSPQKVVQAWMSSDSHRRNLLSEQYTTTGMGYTGGYWTQWFLG